MRGLEAFFSGIGFAIASEVRIPFRAMVLVLALGGSQGIYGAAGRWTQDLDVRLIEFEVVARQFEFSPSRLEVSQGDKVRILVRSEDRTHGFAIRKLRIDKILAPNGKVVTIEFEAKEAGTFEIICSESCGSGHKDMKGSLVVEARPLNKVEQP